MQAPKVGSIRFTSALESELGELASGREVVVIVSRAVEDLINLARLLSLARVDARIIYVQDGEVQKDFDEVKAIINRLGEMSFPRDGMIIGIGGGATTDLAGFVAAIWMRGVEWIALPTTLAGMVDASIGGKTGINTSSAKNLVGAFHLPLVTLIDMRFLSTLPRRDVAAGLAEVIKCGFIADSKILELAESITDDELAKPVESLRLREMIQRSVKVKAEIVAQDLHEGGNRAFLNYGHTLGHAIEIAEKFQLRHGEAISIGMVFAAELSSRLHGNDLAPRHRRVLQRFELPVGYQGADFDRLLTIMERDKKVKGGHLRFVTLQSIGSPLLSDNVSIDMAREAFKESIASNRIGM